MPIRYLSTGLRAQAARTIRYLSTAHTSLSARFKGFTSQFVPETPAIHLILRSHHWDPPPPTSVGKRASGGGGGGCLKGRWSSWVAGYGMSVPDFA
eukprot:537183-Rhodomonas_salina.1